MKIKLMKSFLSLVILLSIFSCKNLSGNIDIRGNEAYLVNTTIKNRFEFTVKTIETKNDSIFTYGTEIIQLAPGDEEFLGFIFETSELQYPVIRKQIFHKYEISDNNDIIVNNKHIKSLLERELTASERAALARKKSGKGYKYKQPILFDTTINGKKFKCNFTIEWVTDSLNPFPVDRFKYEYQVTGQVNIKAQ